MQAGLLRQECGEGGAGKYEMMQHPYMVIHFIGKLGKC